MLESCFIKSSMGQLRHEVTLGRRRMLAGVSCCSGLRMRVFQVNRDWVVRDDADDGGFKAGGVVLGHVGKVVLSLRVLRL